MKLVFVAGTFVVGVQSTKCYVYGATLGITDHTLNTDYDIIKANKIAD